MGKQLDELLKTKITGKRFRLRTVDLLLLVFLTLFAIFARVALFGFESWDWIQFLSPWYDELKAVGGLPGLGLSLGDYTPPYLLIMALLTYLPIPGLVGIKLVSCLFDLILAVWMFRMVWQRWRSFPIAALAYGVTLFLPTVLLNSALWGQCDSMFTLFLLMSLSYFLQKRPFAGMLCFSVAFVLKLQSIFFAPFLLVLFLLDRVKLRHFLMIPAVYLVGILPALFAGRPLGELLSIYFVQTGRYSNLSLNAPNLYLFIDSNETAGIPAAAILLCGAVVLLSVYLLYRSRYLLTRERMVLLALYFALLVPFLLPHMHERYFFLADIFALIYAFYQPKRFYLPLLVGGASLAAYLPYLFGGEPISLKLAALAMGAALGIVGYDLFRGAFAEQPSPQRLAPPEEG